ncbi:MAG TPA: hypothetical protein PLF13_00650 [candidate division Zixibacteria bacterium]|mgnify:CR=1 FL=1|nr:hypothetical protein [candidate division Zixibacteria bacterium]
MKSAIALVAIALVVLGASCEARVGGVPIDGSVECISPNRGLTATVVLANDSSYLKVLLPSGDLMATVESWPRGTDWPFVNWLDDSTLFIGSKDIAYHTLNINTGGQTQLEMLLGISADAACIDSGLRRLYILFGGRTDEGPETYVWVYDFDSGALEELHLGVLMDFCFSLAPIGKDSLLYNGTRIKVVSLRDDSEAVLVDDSGSPLLGADSRCSLIDGNRKLVFNASGGQPALYDFTTHRVTEILGLSGFFDPVIAPDASFLYVTDTIPPYRTYRFDGSVLHVVSGIKSH